MTIHSLFTQPAIPHTMTNLEELTFGCLDSTSWGDYELIYPCRFHPRYTVQGPSFLELDFISFREAMEFLCSWTQDNLTSP